MASAPGANAMAEPSKWTIEGASALQKFTLTDSFPIYHLSISYKNSMHSIYAPLKNRTAPDGGVFFHKQLVKHTGIYSVLWLDGAQNRYFETTNIFHLSKGCHLVPENTYIYRLLWPNKPCCDACKGLYPITCNHKVPHTHSKKKNTQKHHMPRNLVDFACWNGIDIINGWLVWSKWWIMISWFLEHAEQVSYQHIFLIEIFAIATNHWK